MGGGSAPKETTTTVKNELPAWMQPYAENTLKVGGSLASQPYNPYPGQTLAPIAPEQLASMYMTSRRAIEGNPLANAAQNMLTGTMSGAYFDNPYLSDAIRQAQNEQLPQIGYMANSAGSFGNSGINQAAVQNLGNIATQMRYANYGDERDRQMMGAQMAPQFADMDYKDAQMLMGVGDARRSYQQELYDEAAGRWSEAQQWPYSQADWFTNILRGAGFGSGEGTSSTTAPNPNRSSGFANAIGGGMMLGGLYDILRG